MSTRRDTKALTNDIQAENDPETGFSDRLARLISEKGISQADLARLTGEPRQSMSAYIGGRIPGASPLLKIADALGVRAHWLLWGQEPQFEQSPEALGDFAIPIVDTIQALSTGLWYDLRVFDGNLLLDDTMMEHMGRSEVRGLVVIINPGDEMEPLIADGAPVVVDTFDTKLRAGLWCYRVGANLLIRRLRRTAEGIESFPANASYPPERYEGDMQKHVALIGRVLWAATNLK